MNEDMARKKLDHTIYVITNSGKYFEWEKCQLQETLKDKLKTCFPVMIENR